MGCGAEMRLTWKELKYVDGMAVGASVGDSVWIECEGCKAHQFDSPTVRRHIVEAGHWQAQNPTPEPGVVSYHWNALLPPWIRWADLVKEWLRANELKKMGNLEPLKIFICETLGEPWEDRINVADYAQIAQRKTEFRAGDVWPFAKRIFLTADVQADVIYWTARAWGLGGISQQIDYGRVFTFDDLRAVQQRLAIKDNDVGVDSGFRTSEVYQQCQRWGWHPIKGTPQDHFVHHEPDGSQVRRLWSVTRADPAMGTTAQGATTLPLFLFSTDSIADMLALFINGSGPAWGLLADVSDEYQQHLAAEKPEIDQKNGKRVWRKIGRQNHWLDCERMSLVAAVILGLVASEEKKEIPK